MFSTLAWPVLALLAGLPAAAEPPPSLPIFDGKTLNGWTKVGGGATFRVEDGTFVGDVGPGANTFLRTEKTYGDFRLELDARLDVPGNSGIQFRSHQKPGENGQVFGYQCEIDPSPRAWTAGIYDEGRRGWLFPLTGRPEAQKAFRLDDWNHFVIEARGPSLQTWLNGVPCADLIDTEDWEGFIALQVHAGKSGRIRWKNITIQDFGHSTPSPLFNGKTLQGWQASGGGHWSVEDGEIHGTSATAERAHGHLFSNARFGDFALRFQVKPERGDSGVYFHAEEAGKSGVAGLQVNIDPEKDTGGIYEIDGRGWLFRPETAVIQKALKPGAWNTVAIVALADRVVVHVNGTKIADLRDDKAARAGRFALQVHAGQDVDVRFKQIEVVALDPR
ncbi:MAG: DUF1080 domain-containing protein [Isosphaeraceae bacterium]|nr:DUF1080 domain-containing protein [Isosphaeraceae bacterium]